MININLIKDWIRGFTDAEGCFNVHVTRNVTTKLGSQVKLRYILSQKNMNDQLFEIIDQIFKGGRIYTDSIVFSRQDVIFNTIIPFFQENPLLTNKEKDFQLWVKCANLIKNKEHLTPEGLEKINAIKKVINIKPDVGSVNLLPLSLSYKEGWVLGFLEGESCFYLEVNDKGKNLKVQPRLEVGLHPVDHHILIGLNSFFNNVGEFNYSSFYPHWYIRGINKCDQYVLPFFDTYPPVTEKKYKEYFLWKEAVLLAKNKEHLNPNGATRIKEIKEILSRNPK